MTQFCNVNGVNYYTLRAWISWYNEKKDAWQVAITNEGQIVEEIKPALSTELRSNLELWAGLLTYLPVWNLPGHRGQWRLLHSKGLNAHPNDT